jgi:hypothetical protein
MDSKSLDTMLERLAELMPEKSHWTGIGLQRHDWRPFWQLAGEIQQGFKSGVRYPTKPLRDLAWTNFNQLRDEAAKRGQVERDMLFSRSDEHRKDIFRQVSTAEYSPLTDMLFFFDPTTVENMKTKGRDLAAAMKMLSARKHEMLGEHKKECFDRFQEIKESHDLFWRRYQEANSARREQYQEKRSGMVTRAMANLEKNRDKLRNAVDALERHRARADELREKISTARTEKWESIFETWLSETEAKIDDIEASIRRIHEWIEEDERRLGELQ